MTTDFFAKEAAQSPDSLAVNYDEGISLYKFLFRLGDLRRHIKSGRLLDHGCGYGYFFNFAKKYFHCVGADASPFAIAQAEKINPDCTFALISAEDPVLPFIPNTFDVVTSFDVIEHSLRGDEMIAEYARVLRSGGILMIHTPTDWSGSIIPPETHVNLYSESRLRKVLHDSGFVIEKFYYSQALMYVERWLSSLRRHPLRASDSPARIDNNNGKSCLKILKRVIYLINRWVSYFVRGPEYLVIARKC